MTECKIKYFLTFNWSRGIIHNITVKEVQNKMLSIYNENYHFSFKVSEEVKADHATEDDTIYYARRVTRDNYIVFWFLDNGDTMGEADYTLDEVSEYVVDEDWVLIEGEFSG